MARYPLLLILALAGGALLLTGMVNRQPPPPTQPPSPAESAEAARILDRAAEAYDPARVAWAEVKLWQQNQDEGATREVRGRFVAAPGHRARLELQTQVGGTSGEMILVSDGKQLWQSSRYGDRPAKVVRFELPRYEPGVNTAAWAEWARGETAREHTFAGAGPLLKGLRARLQGLRSAPARWKGGEAIRVSGTLPDDPEKLKWVPEFARPRQPPRLCAVYLDARTLWPHRLEWWATAGRADGPVLVMATEFRDPVLNQPLPDERCAREFGVPGGWAGENGPAKPQ